MKTSIVILTYNKLEYTKLCIESIRQYTTPGTYELIIVDNNSTDDTVAWLQQQPDLKLILNQENNGFPKGCNQGIDISTGDNILLLNNDVVVTENWLDNLVTALYSSDDIGAVGPITNYCSYLQNMPVSYQTLEDMQQFAAEFNRINPKKWEERLKLIGYCMLIKGEVVRQVGTLDEIFTPGNFEDDDYSVRIRRLGYRLLFCKDTFIHHFGSTSWRDNVDKFSTLLHVNEQKFQDKWGYSASKAMMIYHNLVKLIDKPVDSELNVLEVNCGSGGTLLKIKDQFKKAHLFGIEPNGNAAREAYAFADIRVASLEDEHLIYPESFFDVILLPNVLEFVRQPEQVLRKLMTYLKPNGTLIAGVRNITYFEVFKNLLQGRPIYNTPNTHYYALEEVDHLFRSAGFEFVEIVPENGNIPQTDHDMLEKLTSISNPLVRKQYSITQWLLRAKRTRNSELEEILQDLRADDKAVEKLNRLNQYPLTEVLNTIRQFGDEVDRLNLLANLNFINGHHEKVLPFLQEAFAIDSKNANTLYNLGYVLHAYQEHTLALRYLNMIAEPDAEVQALIDQIREQEQGVEQQRQALRFLLHRIEFDIDQAESLVSLTESISAGTLQEADILEMVRTQSIDRPKTLNAVAVACYNAGLYEHVIPYLQAALQYDSEHVDTLFNLGMVLHSVGEPAKALAYLEKIPQPDEEIRAMIATLKLEA